MRGTQAAGTSSSNAGAGAGCVVLVALLEANPRLICLNVKGTHFTR